MLRKTNPTQLRAPAQNPDMEAPTQIWVGVVASHLLAAHYLVELVKHNLNMAPVLLSEGIKSAHVFPPGCPAIILVDLWGLPLPTCEYVEAFGKAISGCAFLALDRARKGTDIAQLLRAGFSGFVSHDEALYVLGPAIEAVAKRRIWTSPEVIRIYMNLTSQRTALRSTGVEMLTIRENQILDLLRRRCSNNEMAKMLGISESTVKFHVSNVLMKFNASNRRDLATTDLVDSRLMLSSEHPGMGIGTPTIRKNPGRVTDQQAQDGEPARPETLAQRARTGS